MRVTTTRAGTLIGSADPNRQAPRSLETLLRSVAACLPASRPFYYEVEDDYVALVGRAPIGRPIPLADGRSRRIEIHFDRSADVATVALTGTNPVSFLLETAALGDLRCFVDPLAAEVTSIAGPEPGRSELAADLGRLAVAAGLEVLELAGDGSGSRSHARISVTELHSRFGGATTTDAPAVLVLGDEQDLGNNLAGLMTLAHAGVGLALCLTGVVAEAEVVFVASSPPAAFLRTPGRTADDHVGELVEVGAPIEIAILGPTEISGGEGSLIGRPRLTELVVYLAMHPGGAATKTWSAALWPDRRVPPQTVANRLSEARRLLGFATDGRPRLRRSGDRHLLANVETDWSRFSRLAGSASPESWREALGLVRGRPFDDLAQGSWTVLEGFIGEIESAVVECALRLGECCLSSGDPEGAAFAAQMAIRASPWDERLHRLLMLAADAAGNRSGMEEILRHLALMLEVDGDPLDGVHRETAELYARLSGRPIGAPGR